MEVLAKITKDRTKTQTLLEHTLDVVKEAIKLIDEETLSLVAKEIEFDKEKLRDLIFFSAYFHDIGKSTKEFQDAILNGKHSYHGLYSASLLLDIEDFEYSDNEYFVNMLFLTVLTHHSIFHNGLYSEKKYYNFEFLEDTENFFEDYKVYYEHILQKKCNYNFKYEIENKEKLFDEINLYLKDDIKNIKNLKNFRLLYSYVLGILNIADWIASAKFDNFTPQIEFNKTFTKDIFIDKFKTIKRLENLNLKPFQDELSKCIKSVLVEIPTGEGKTEGALLWAINNIRDKNSKIIYTLPTTTTSNKLYERVEEIFEKENCGLVHSVAKVYLEDIYKNESGKVDDNFKSEFLLQKSFNKPITVSTIDGVLKYFINIGRYNIATFNFLNSVIVVDEVHSYDLKLLGFIKRFLELAQELNIKVCLMSASIPNKIKQLLNIDKFTLIKDEKLFNKKANEIIKIDSNLDEDLETIINHYKSGKKVLVVRNRIDNSVKTYNNLKDTCENITLYNSQFKKIDRAKKENEIYDKLKENEAYILVATQVVEISLDIDFDVMFSDVAPIDSLIQRFGRVNRHKDENKIGKIFIYNSNEAKPYYDFMLKVTFETIQNGIYPISKYVEWLNSIYDELFEDKKTKNKVSGLFQKGYDKFDLTLKTLNAISKSSDNYDLRDIEFIKQDFLLKDDFYEDRLDFKFTISLPLYFKDKYQIERDNKKTKYPVLNLDYKYDIGIINDKEGGIITDD